MQERQASNTAIFTAVIRAAHQILDAHPKILDDPIAIGLVEGSSEAEIHAQEPDLQQPLKRLVRAGLVVRSRFTEDQLAEAVKAGIHQYVLLGAGLDTFAYRQPAWARPLRIIEVDHPASQAFKREHLEHARVTIPDNIVFCPIDFERTTLQEGLDAVAFDPQVPTFFSWLGVTPYLTEDAIFNTLRVVASLALGSEIVFSYVVPEALLIDEEHQRLWAALKASAAALGEPWLSFFEPAHLEARIRELGFTQVWDLGPEEANAQFCAGRTDGLRIPSWLHLMSARVGGVR